MKTSGRPLDNQFNLAYKRLTAIKTSKVWFSYSHNCTLANGAVFHSVCSPEFFTFSYCAWLWNWLTTWILKCSPSQVGVCDVEAGQSVTTICKTVITKCCYQNSFTRLCVAADRGPGTFEVLEKFKILTWFNKNCNTNTYNSTDKPQHLHLPSSTLDSYNMAPNLTALWLITWILLKIFCNLRHVCVRPLLGNNYRLSKILNLSFLS